MLWKSLRPLLADHVGRVVPGLGWHSDVDQHDHGQHDRDHPHHAAEPTVHRAPIDEQERAHQASVLLRRRPTGAFVTSPCTPCAYPAGTTSNQSNRRVAGRLLKRVTQGKSLSLTAIFFVIGLLLLPLAREGRRRLAPE